jgi:hypothetical protein
MGVRSQEDVDRIHKSHADASVCCRCGRAIAAGAPVYLLRCRLIWFHGAGVICIYDDRLAAGCAACARDCKPVHAGECPGCGRLVTVLLEELAKNRNRLLPLLFCSHRCRNRVYGARFRKRHPRPKTVRALIPCSVCGRNFAPKRSDAKTCSPACRQKAYRDRHVTVSGE